MIWTDGGARGNPGPAGIGARITQNDQVLAELSDYIGKATNNQAEYQALLRALEWLVNHIESTSSYQVQVLTDSELMAYQIQGRYRVKNTDLQPIYHQVMRRLNQFSGYTIIPVSREKNQLADRLVNQAIDRAGAQ